MFNTSVTQEFAPTLQSATVIQGMFCIKRTLVKDGQTKIAHVSPGAFDHCAAIAKAAAASYPQRHWITTNVGGQWDIFGNNGTVVKFEIVPLTDDLDVADRKPSEVKIREEKTAAPVKPVKTAAPVKPVAPKKAAPKKADPVYTLHVTEIRKGKKTVSTYGETSKGSREDAMLDLAAKWEKRGATVNLTAKTIRITTGTGATLVLKIAKVK